MWVESVINKYVLQCKIHVASTCLSTLLIKWVRSRLVFVKIRFTA